MSAKAEHQSLTLETERHLFQAPFYTIGDGYWSANFNEIARRSPSLTWDPAGILSYLTYGYVSGNRTLFREIKRQPWVSSIDQHGEIQLAAPKPHDFYRMPAKQIGARLLELLENEAEVVCKGRSEVYVLTSGGLDSRIVAGVVRRLIDQKRIDSKIHAVTWGREGSRDVEIGRIVAERLNFDWKHLPLGPGNFLKNIDHAAEELGAMVSPVHLHRMMWFRQQPQGGLVLGGSYGDSVGRAEFSGRTVLELLPYQAHNSFGLLNTRSMAEGKQKLEDDWKEFRNRLGDTPGYGVRECEFQAHYMRGLIAQTMSVVNGPCQLYQMFTSPEVYGFMWSVHPSFRDDRPYAHVLRQLGNDLHELPWARTNRSLGTGKTVPVDARHKQYYDYVKWTRENVLPSIDESDFTNWLIETKLFDEPAVKNTLELARSSNVPWATRQSTSMIVWMIALRKLVDSLGIHPVVEFDQSVDVPPSYSGEETKFSMITRLRHNLREIPWALSTARSLRKWVRRRKAILQYPPKSYPIQKHV